MIDWNAGNNDSWMGVKYNVGPDADDVRKAVRLSCGLPGCDVCDLEGSVAPHSVGYHCGKPGCDICDAYKYVALTDCPACKEADSLLAFVERLDSVWHDDLALKMWAIEAKKRLLE